ncbi:MAG: hypothetical protein M0R06_19000 [Sphaerochaeta sp.]|jgi:hypothetical protein|nr:hypothetical protein [Sphaerochaeta sp.]
MTTELIRAELKTVADRLRFLASQPEVAEFPESLIDDAVENLDSASDALKNSEDDARDIDAETKDANLDLP